jgi:hypothetical protein
LQPVGAVAAGFGAGDTVEGWWCSQFEGGVELGGASSSVMCDGLDVDAVVEDDLHERVLHAILHGVDGDRPATDHVAGLTGMCVPALVGARVDHEHHIGRGRPPRPRTFAD